MVCSDINERYDIGYASLPQPLRFFFSSNLGVSGFSYCIFVSFESSQLSEFSTDLKNSDFYNYFIMSETGLSSHEAVYVIVIFQYLIKCRKNFLRHPVVGKSNMTSNVRKALVIVAAKNADICFGSIRSTAQMRLAFSK